MHDTATPAFAVVHAARVRGIVPDDARGELASDSEFEQLERDGLVKRTARGLIATPVGLREHDSTLEAWRGDLGPVGVVAATYERFLVLNAPLKAVCSAWQRSARDEEALFSVAGQLDDYLSRVRPLISRAARDAPWFATYASRLSAAAAAVAAGDGRFVTDPQVDSFHNIWFECHEDYFVTLGRSREDEEAA
ncbi:hypothetical protein AB0L40_09210 [Patulibacter sp. NPDC049589]|uniref:hypothetical protein n=1 Tax=Patulibacter sp. NPDC049589 TaxID=3154731 RepID=UPI00343614C4